MLGIEETRKHLGSKAASAVYMKDKSCPIAAQDLFSKQYFWRIPWQELDILLNERCVAHSRHKRQYSDIRAAKIMIQTLLVSPACIAQLSTQNLLKPHTLHQCLCQQYLDRHLIISFWNNLRPTKNQFNWTVFCSESVIEHAAKCWKWPT